MRQLSDQDLPIQARSLARFPQQPALLFLIRAPVLFAQYIQVLLA
jgi:hypothetical protein